MDPPRSRRTRKAGSQTSSNGSEGNGGRVNGDGGGGVQVTLSQYSQLNSPSQPNFVLQFVMPEGHTQGGCSPRLSSAYNICSEDYSLCCQWVDESQVLDIIPMAGMIFVLDPFEGPGFDYLEEELKRRKEKDYMVIGPQCLRYSLERPDTDPAQSTILNRGYPMYNLGMRNLVVSLSGFRNQGAKSELSNLIRKMGGYPTPQLTMATSHLVTDNPLSEKCAYAYKRNLPVMTDKWVKETWAQSLDGLVHATDPEFTKYECPVFFNLGFCVSQVSGKTKSHLKTIITKNGGNYSPDLLKDKTNILVIAKGEGDKFKYSMQWGIKCVTPDWVIESVEANHVLRMDDYIVHPVAPPMSSTALESRLQAPFPDASFSVIANGTRMPGSRSNYTTPTKNSNCSITSEATMDDFETIKNASAVGPFLDGCKVFLCGPAKSEQVRKLLNGSGATRMNQLTEDVSHIVVMGGRISEEEKAAIQQLDPKPHVVGFEWLTESAKQGAPANEEPFQTLVKEEDVHKISSTSSKNYTLTTNKDRTPTPPARPTVVEEIAPPAPETPCSPIRMPVSAIGKVTGLTAFIRRESTGSLVGTPLQNFSPDPTNTSTPTCAAQQLHSQSYTESIQEQAPVQDLNSSTNIPSESNSPRFGGLSRAASRQIFEAARLMGMGSPNSTFNEIAIKLPPKPASTPEHVWFKKIWDQFLPSPELKSNAFDKAQSEEPSITVPPRELKSSSFENAQTEEPSITVPPLELKNSFENVQTEEPITVPPRELKNSFVNGRSEEEPSITAPPREPKSDRFESVQPDEPSTIVPPRKLRSNCFERVQPEEPSVTAPQREPKSNQFESVQFDEPSITVPPRKLRSNGFERAQLEEPSVTAPQREPKSNQFESVQFDEPSITVPPRKLRSNRFESVQSDGPSITMSHKSSLFRVDKTGSLPSSSTHNVLKQGDFDNSTSKSKRRKTGSDNSGAGWGDNRLQKLIFMFTGVTDDDRKRYAAVIQKLGGILNNSSKFTMNVDAIIAGSLARSEKVLCSIASGKRVLHTNYLISSNNSGSFLPDPNIYLWGVGDGKTPAEEHLANACGYWFARISGNPNEKPFSKFRAVVLENSKSKADAYSSLITAGGGKVLGKDAIASNDANIIICESKEALKKILDTDDLPKIAVKPPFCLHEIIIKCEPCDDSFFDAN